MLETNHTHVRLSWLAVCMDLRGGAYALMGMFDSSFDSSTVCLFFAPIAGVCKSEWPPKSGSVTPGGVSAGDGSTILLVRVDHHCQSGDGSTKKWRDTTYLYG